jgi:Sulfotransferase family
MSISRPSRRQGSPGAGIPDPRGKRQWAELYAASALSALDVRNRSTFRDVERFCLFIGYSRSGHTLVGTMLNAHPEMVIAHELDAVRFVMHGFRRSQLFPLLLQRDRQFGSMGRTWSNYEYEIPDQYQGRFERLRVIGDKRARSTVLQIAGDPKALDRVRRVVDVPLKVLHVTRNPFDNIATEARRHKMSLTASTEWYEQICRAISQVRPLLDASELIDIEYETFAAHPRRSLATLCESIGIEAEPSYLEACAGIVWPSTNRSREAVDWSVDERRGVERLIEKYEVLQSYSFDV